MSIRSRLCLTGSIVLGALGLGALHLAAQDDDLTAALATPAPEEARALYFVTSQACAKCHSNSDETMAMRDESKRWIAPYDLWRSSMMANAARDPLYRAVVSVEAAETPTRSAEIEARCLKCHAPLASVELEKRDEPTLGLAMLKTGGLRSQLALDGVACTACHQIQPTGLGTAESFNGGYVIGNERTIFGPHQHPVSGPMQKAVGFTPTHGEHFLSAELCGSCHTQFNESYTADGKPTSTLYPEQVSFLEWRNSAYNTADGKGLTCQSCHVPQYSQEGKPLLTAIARGVDGKSLPSVGDREPYGRHTFTGANTLVPAILRDNAQLIPTNASREAFDATIAMAREQLQKRSASLKLGKLSLETNTLKIPVRLENRSGHKLPTGHPTRRVWLRVRVTDGEGRLVFVSGEHDAQGRILGAQGQVLASELAGGPVQIHHRIVDSADAVQIYESVAHDADGKVTYLLTRATGHQKDNRVLPRGWSFERPDQQATLPQGIGGDPNFTGGSDELVYSVDVGEHPGPFKVEAALLYQTLGARYAAELFTHETPEMKAFQQLYRAADRTPVIVTEANVTLESG